MPAGYVATVGLVIACLLVSVRPLARSGPLGTVSWLMTQIVNEAPVLAFWWLAASTLPVLAGGCGQMLDDVHRVIAWVRQHAASYGGDPAAIVVAGSSAGAHLALTAALTDPGEGVLAAVGLYGYYGQVDGDDPWSRPQACIGERVPPMMIVHGGQDTLVPPRGARQLAEALRAASTAPVVYAELPGAQHAFDLVHSLRFELIIDAI